MYTPDICCLLVLILTIKKTISISQVKLATSCFKELFPILVWPRPEQRGSKLNLKSQRRVLMEGQRIKLIANEGTKVKKLAALF